MFRGYLSLHVLIAIMICVHINIPQEGQMSYSPCWPYKYGLCVSPNVFILQTNFISFFYKCFRDAFAQMAIDAQVPYDDSRKAGYEICTIGPLSYEGEGNNTFSDCDLPCRTDCTISAQVSYISRQKCSACHPCTGDLFDNHLMPSVGIT